MHLVKQLPPFFIIERKEAKQQDTAETVADVSQEDSGPIIWSHRIEIIDAR